jgi:hypothetical protein
MMGLSEDEYLTIVEHIQQAMCIDVVALIGDWQVLHREIERLRAELHRVAESRRAVRETAAAAIEGSKEEVERLRAALEKLCDESEHVIHQGDRYCACGRAVLA